MPLFHIFAEIKINSFLIAIAVNVSFRANKKRGALHVNIAACFLVLLLWKKPLKMINNLLETVRRCFVEKKSLCQYYVVVIGDVERILPEAPLPVVHLKDEKYRAGGAANLAAKKPAFDDDTPISLINLLRPDVLANGNDYSESQVVGANEVHAWGGEVALIPVSESRSTGQVISKLLR